jgi:hypothetical protein
MPPNILKITQRHRSEIDKADAANLRQVSDAYVNMYDNLAGDVEALRLAIEAAGSPSPAEVKRMPQYKRLLQHGTDELDRFTVYLQTVVGAASLASIGLGLAHSKELINVMTQAKFKGLDAGVMRYLLDYLQKDGPLYKRLDLITTSTVDKVIAQIVDGVSMGRNPRVIASLIQDAFGGGLTDALRNTRTVQLWSYRDSARANYTATDGIVTGWIWYAELDADTCLSCVAQHGTIHDLDETLDDHYNGRCAALPYIEQFGNPVEQNGQDWFDSLPEAQQQQMMGQEKHGAYRDGKFEFDQLSAQGPNDIYGTMRTEASLKSLIGESE